MKCDGVVSIRFGYRLISRSMNLSLGFSNEEFLGLVIGVSIGGILIIVAIILVGVKPIRRKVFPYKDRRQFRPGQ